MTFSKGEMKRMNSVYGNGAVYASDGKRVFQYVAANFRAEKLSTKNSLDLDMQEEELLVCVGGYTSKAGAIRALDLIKKRIELIPESDFNPLESDFKDTAELDVVNCWPERRR